VSDARTLRTPARTLRTPRTIRTPIRTMPSMNYICILKGCNRTPIKRLHLLRISDLMQIHILFKVGDLHQMPKIGKSAKKHLAKRGIDGYSIHATSDG
jgi:hypothetical protein